MSMCKGIIVLPYSYFKYITIVLYVTYASLMGLWWPYLLRNNKYGGKRVGLAPSNRVEEASPIGGSLAAG
jgi:hypothetical protein